MARGPAGGPAKKTKNIYHSKYKDTTRQFQGLWHLLLRWKGSLFKLIYQEFLVFLAAYFALSILYR